MKDSNKVIRVCEVKFYTINLFSLSIDVILSFS